MNWNSQPETESQPAPREEVGPAAQPSPALPPREASAPRRHDISIRKSRVVAPEAGKEKEMEVFTMSLGGETIELLPLRSWAQLDVHKWTVRGKLPGSPAGLEIAPDHVKILSQNVSTSDPEGCAKLQELFDEWLTLEKENLELARKKSQAKPRPAAQDSSGQPEAAAARFHVERDNTGQVHVRRMQGKEMMAEIGLNLPGFGGLFSQGLMRKPKKLQIGVLHDWIELDGELFNFAKGNDDSAKLEQALNAKYLPDSSLGTGKSVVVFANAASSTGFDIQFRAKSGGVLENRKRPMVEESLALLQDPVACGLLHKELVIKLTRPNLVFKQRTPDGGERYLERSPEHTVIVTADDGAQKVIDLSQPVSYMRLTPIELTAVFNHPAINRHSQTQPEAAAAPKPPPPPQPALEPAGAEVLAAAPAGPTAPAATPAQKPPEPPPQPAPPKPQPSTSQAPPQRSVEAPPREVPAAPAARGPAPAAEPAGAGAPPAAPPPPKPLPNSWLAEVLAQPPIRHDWFACTMYGTLAKRFGNSHDGVFGPSHCWSVALGETEDIGEPGFKGLYLTEKHGLGFLCEGQTARFNRGVAFVGTQETAIQGIGVNLVAVGLDTQERFVFVITDGYRKQFGVPEQSLAQEFARLEKHGALIRSVSELLHGQDPIEVLWTVPAAQEDPSDPQALESVRPPNQPLDTRPGFG